jgi:hypothetical protein
MQISIKLKRTPLLLTILVSLLHDQLPGQPHQLLAQLLVLRHLAPALRHRRRTHIEPALLHLGRGKHGADRTHPLILLERLHQRAHGVAGDRVRLVDVVDGYLGLDEARVGGVGEDVGVGGGQVPGEVARVEDVGELGAAVEAVGAEVAVQLGEEANSVSDGVAWCALEPWIEMRTTVWPADEEEGEAAVDLSKGSRCEVRITWPCG